jgi:hypothetical protein
MPVEMPVALQSGAQNVPHVLEQWPSCRFLAGFAQEALPAKMQEGQHSMEQTTFETSRQKRCGWLPGRTRACFAFYSPIRFCYCPKNLSRGWTDVGIPEN